MIISNKQVQNILSLNQVTGAKKKAKWIIMLGWNQRLAIMAAKDIGLSARFQGMAYIAGGASA